MKKYLFFSLILSAMVLVGCQNLDENKMRHIVVFKYKSDATKEQIAEVTNALSDLQNTIPGIVSFEHGVNDSPENKNAGFTHIYLFTFENAEARDTYLPHPDHEAFGKMLEEMDVVEDVFVVDYTPLN